MTAGRGACSPLKTSNELWVVEMTDHRSRGGMLSRCAVKDGFSGRFVGCWIVPRMKSRPVVKELENEVAISAAGVFLGPGPVTAWCDRWAESAAVVGMRRVIVFRPSN
jgi:hypothetical protein